MPNIYLHQIPIKNSYPAVEVSLLTDFKVVGGLTTPQFDAPRFFPCYQCDNNEYLMVGGTDGIPYSPRLGRAGGSPTVIFGYGLSALIVATYQETEPVFVLKPPMYIQAQATTAVGTDAAAAQAKVTFANSGLIQVNRNGPAVPIATWRAEYPVGTKFALKAGHTITTSTFLAVS